MVREEANTRMRDFYDIRVLIEQDAETIDRDTMKAAFYATCNKRGSIELIGTIDDVLNKISDDETMRQLWNNYRKSNLRGCIRMGRCDRECKKIKNND